MKNIIFIGVTQDYPIKFSASNTKVEFMAKGLHELGHDITIINNERGSKGVCKLEKKENAFSKSILFPEKGLLKNYLTLFSILKNTKKKDGENYIIYGFSLLYPMAVSTFIISKVLSYKLLFIFHEDHKSFELSYFKRVSCHLFDNTFGYFGDAILPISSFLKEKANHFKKPQHILPALADFKSVVNEEQFKDGDYFLYCGHAGYLRLIEVVLHAFKAIETTSEKGLRLVLTGKPSEIEKVQQKIIDYNINNVEIYTDVPYKELILFYRNALALLLPLSEKSLQDKSRFSQKIPEYLSSKRPIITVAVGVINEYFTDKKDAFICETNTPQEFTKKFKYVIENPNDANLVGINGFELGLVKFDYDSNAKSLDKFVDNLKELNDDIK